MLLTKLRSFTAIDVVNVVTVFCQEFWIAGVKSESVAASFQFCYVVVAFIIFIAGGVMGVEAEIVRTFEGVLCASCNKK